MSAKGALKRPAVGKNNNNKNTTTTTFLPKVGKKNEKQTSYLEWHHKKLSENNVSNIANASDNISFDINDEVERRNTPVNVMNVPVQPIVVDPWISSLDLLFLSNDHGINEARNLNEFLIITLNKVLFDYSLEQIIALLKPTQKSMLSAFIVSDTRANQWYLLIGSSFPTLIPLIVKDPEVRIPFFLDVVSLGMASMSTEVALTTSYLMRQFIESIVEVDVTLHIALWHWFIGDIIDSKEIGETDEKKTIVIGGLQPLLVCFDTHHRGSPEVVANVVNIIDRITRPLDKYFLLFSDILKNQPQLKDPGNFMEFIHNYLGCMSENEITKRSLVNSTVVNYLLVFALYYSQSDCPLSTETSRTGAMVLLTDFWILFEGVLEASNYATEAIKQCLKRACKDPLLETQTCAVRCLFELLSYYYRRLVENTSEFDGSINLSSPRTSTEAFFNHMYKRLIFTILENRPQDPIRQYIVTNLMAFFRDRDQMPISLTVQALVRQVTICGYSDLDFEFFSEVAQHSMFTSTQAVQILPPLCVLCLKEDLTTSESAFRPLLTIYQRFGTVEQVMRIVYDFVMRCLGLLVNVETAIRSLESSSPKRDPPAKENHNIAQDFITPLNISLMNVQSSPRLQALKNHRRFLLDVLNNMFKFSHPHVIESARQNLTTALKSLTKVTPYTIMDLMHSFFPKVFPSSSAQSNAIINNYNNNNNNNNNNMNINFNPINAYNNNNNNNNNKNLNVPNNQQRSKNSNTLSPPFFPLPSTPPPKEDKYYNYNEPQNLILDTDIYGTKTQKIQSVNPKDLLEQIDQMETFEKKEVAKKEIEPGSYFVYSDENADMIHSDQEVKTHHTDLAVKDCEEDDDKVDNLSQNFQDQTLQELNNQLDEHIQKEKSAVMVQKIWRGYITRSKLEKERIEDNENSENKEVSEVQPVESSNLNSNSDSNPNPKSKTLTQGRKKAGNPRKPNGTTTTQKKAAAIKKPEKPHPNKKVTKIETQPSTVIVKENNPQETRTSTTSIPRSLSNLSSDTYDIM